MNENENNPETTSTGDAESVVAEVVETTPEVEVVAEAAAPDKVEETVEAITKTEEKEEPVAEAVTSVEEVVAADAVTPLKKVMVCARRYKYTILAVVLVLVAILGLTYVMESEGRIHTGMFDKVNKFADNYKAVAKINGVKATKHDLDVSVAQLSSAAGAQGADITDPKVLDGIRSQALDMLVNTELLKQEAATRGIAISDEDVNKRLETLKTDVGGEDVLKQRMAQFDVDEKSLRRDIKSELTIQTLLDQVFKEKGIAVSDEEIKAFYDQAAGAGKKADLPKLEAVRDQIEKQLRSSKEQEAVTSYIEELRKKATIEVLI